MGSPEPAVVLAVAEQRKGYSSTGDGLGTNGWGSASSHHYGLAAAAVVEIVLTAELVFTVLAATADTASPVVAGAPIGIALVVAHLVGGMLAAGLYRVLATARRD